MRLTLSGRSFIKIQLSSFPLFPVAYPFRIATQLQCYVKCEKCKVNDVIFPSGCEARTINLGNKNVKIGIFTSATSVRSKNIFTDISRYSIGKHEIKENILPDAVVRYCYAVKKEWPPVTNDIGRGVLGYRPTESVELDQTVQMCRLI